MHGPWMKMNNLRTVDSEMSGGKGLSTDQVDGVVGLEERGKQDSATRTTTAPPIEELIGVADLKSNSATK